MTPMVTISLIVGLMGAMRSGQPAPPPLLIRTRTRKKAAGVRGLAPGQVDPWTRGDHGFGEPGGAGMGTEPRWHDGGMLHHRSGQEHIWSAPRYIEIRNHGKQPGWSRAGLNGYGAAFAGAWLLLDAITGGSGVRKVGKTVSGGRHPHGREDMWWAPRASKVRNRQE